jgi:hypothetical protein
MLRRAAEVVAITAGIALAAGIAGVLGLGVTRAIPAIGGAALVTGLVFYHRTRSTSHLAASAICSGLGAFALDWFVVFVLGAGYPELREFRRGPIYQSLFVLIFAAVASWDVTSASSAGDARP